MSTQEIILNQKLIWLDDNQEKVKTIEEILATLLNPCSKEILNTLNINDNLTCKDILSAGVGNKFSEKTVYKCLKSLEESNFIIAKTKVIEEKQPITKGRVIYISNDTGELTFSINTHELCKLIDAIDQNKFVSKSLEHETIQLANISPNTSAKYVLDYILLMDIYDKTCCFFSEVKCRIVETLLFNGNYAKDATLISKKKSDIQSTIFRNLIRMSEWNLVIRTKDGKNVYNSLVIENVITAIEILESLSYLSKHPIRSRYDKVVTLPNGLSFRITDTGQIKYIKIKKAVN